MTLGFRRCDHTAPAMSVRPLSPSATRSSTALVSTLWRLVDGGLAVLHPIASIHDDEDLRRGHVRAGHEALKSHEFLAVRLRVELHAVVLADRERDRIRLGFERD